MRRVKNCSLTEKPRSCDVAQNELTMETQSISHANNNSDHYFSIYNNDVQNSKNNPYFKCFVEMSHHDAYLIIKSLPLKTSPLDILPTFLLKRFSTIRCPIIAKLANLSFSQAVFPSNFKTAQVNPFLKISIWTNLIFPIIDRCPILQHYIKFLKRLPYPNSPLIYSHIILQQVSICLQQTSFVQNCSSTRNRHTQKSSR